MDQEASTARAAQLKEEGNKLFAAKNFPTAYRKYSKAIDANDKNAILYANRGACSMSMRKYLDAATDCKKATELDPLYAKAWMRLGMAHNNLAQYEQSIQSIEKAISVLPIENLTPADIKLREQAELELKTVKRRVAPENVQVHHLTSTIEADKMPWQRAAKLVEERLAKYGQTNEGAMSSAWVMGEAAEQWKEGMRIMKQAKRVRTAQGEGWQVMSGALINLSNAILTDERVFHIDDQNFIEKYNIQVASECKKDNAWGDSGPQQVCPEALKMQKEKGWDAVRPALSTTVRAYIMRGFMESGLRNRPDVGVEFIERAIEIIEWGRKVWRTVDKRDRGVIFEDTFLRGVQNLHLDVFMKAYQMQPGLDAKYSLEDLLHHAEEIIKGSRNNASPGASVGFALAYEVYPKAHAYAMVGFYHSQMAKLSEAQGVEVEKEHYREAADAYLEAALAFPPDDENHSWFIKCALDNLYLCGTPIKVLLPLMKMLRESLPEMKRLWEHSSAAMGGRDDALQQYLWMEEDIQKAVLEGKFTPDSMVMPETQRGSR